MNDKLAWYVSRSSGWVAFILLAVTVVWGILGITKIIERRGLPRWMLDLHRYVALLTVVFTAVHLAALVADNYIYIGWKELFVPYELEWRPGAVTLGIVAFYMIVAVQLSSWLRSRLPRRVWRGVHMLSYPALWMVAMHGLRAGTDATTWPVRGGVIAVIAATSFFTVARIAASGRKRHTISRTRIPPPAADPTPATDPGAPADPASTVGNHRPAPNLVLDGTRPG